MHLLCVRYRSEVARHRYSDGSLPQNGPIVPGLLSQEQIDLMLGESVLQADILNHWESQVAKAYLPEETELDKLRDAVPRDAKDQLYGVVNLKDA